MSYSTKNDHTILSEQYQLIRQSQTFNEQIELLDATLRETIDEIKINEGLAGLGTRTKDRLSGAAAQAGTMFKNLGGLGKAVTQGKAENLRDPRVAARQKKINNVIGRFNRDMTALVPDLEKQHPEIHAAVTMLNQAQNAPAASQSSDQSQNQTNTTVADTSTTSTTPATPAGPAKVGGSSDPVNPTKDKESPLKRMIKKPGQLLKSADKFAKDLESSTASGGIEGAVADASEPATPATSATPKPAKPVAPVTEPAKPVAPDAPVATEPTPPVTEPAKPVTPDVPEADEEPGFEPGEEVIVRTIKNPTGQGGVVKQINPNGTILVTTPGNPSGYAFNPANVSKSSRVANNALNENLLGGCGFMSNKWLNL